MANFEGEMLKEKELPIKRFYIPGLKLVDNCPNCGKIRTVDFKNYCIDYPIANGINKVYMGCDECNHDWEVSILIEFNMKIVDKA